MIRLVLVWLLLVVLLGTPTAVVAQQRSVDWQRYDVDLNVQSDGSVRVTETQTIQFQGTYQQGFRVIPTDRVTSIDNVSLEGMAYRTSRLAMRSAQTALTTWSTAWPATSPRVSPGSCCT